MEHLQDSHVFMCCETLRPQAFSEIPRGYHLRCCRQEELDLWKAFPFDTPQEAEEYRPFMDAYYRETYGAQQQLFYERCLFLCDEWDVPQATGFLWKQFGRYDTVHWVKTRKDAEGKGLGRALLSAILRQRTGEEPIYLHTHAGCMRAIHLYTEFGFEILTSPKQIDGRPNEWEQAVEYLRERMPQKYFTALRFRPYP